MARFTARGALSTRPRSIFIVARGGERATVVVTAVSKKEVVAAVDSGSGNVGCAVRCWWGGLVARWRSRE